MAKQPVKGPIQNKKKMAMSNYSGSAPMTPMAAPAAGFKKGGKVKSKAKGKK